MWEKIVIFGLVVGSVAIPSVPVAAQGDDIYLRGLAITDCQADPDNHLGYATEQVCIDSTYREYLQKKAYGGGGQWVPGHSDTDPFNQNCNSAASRIPCKG